MTKIALFGLSGDEKAYFKHYLKDEKVTFYPAHIDISLLDPGTEIISVFVDTEVTREIIASLPALKLITCRATGYNNVDLDAAREHGVTVANVPAYGSTTVAEYAFTLLLMLVRHIPEVLHESLSTQPDRLSERGRDLYGKTIGIVGTGKIGLGAARIAAGFGMKVVGYDVHPNSEAAKEIGFKYVENVDELLRMSDVVTLHIPYIPVNHHFLSRARLGKIKHGAIVINTARGELIDTTSLVHALKTGHVSAAALDVLESEYLLDPDRLIELAAHNDVAKQTLRHAVSLAALQRMPNVIITNHNAYNTVEAIERINQTTLENINNFKNGAQVHTVL